jgi:ABC-type multidrug transport system ATPase subunit
MIICLFLIVVIIDAYNAFNVVESLVTLARNYNRTVIFTIHQPRSNIVTLFDQLILLAKGRVIYSGSQTNVQNYFGTIGYNCPPGFNIADYLIDLTMEAVDTDTTEQGEVHISSRPVNVVVEDGSRNDDDAESSDGLTPHLRKIAASYEQSPISTELDTEISEIIRSR